MTNLSRKFNILKLSVLIFMSLFLIALILLLITSYTTEQGKAVNNQFNTYKKICDDICMSNFMSYIDVTIVYVYHNPVCFCKTTNGGIQTFILP